MKLIIEGKESKINRLAKELRLRLKRDGLDSKIKGGKKPKEDSNEENELPKGAGDRIELIKAIETIEDLKLFESDDRATVKKAYEDKLEELTNTES